MELIGLSCNHCGAPLQVPPTARFVQCTHCDSRLAIHESGGARYTEVLEQVRDGQQELASRLAKIEAQNELERCDREWATERERYLISGKDGRRQEPSAAGGIVGGVIVAVGGIAWMVFVTRSSAPTPFALFGVVFVLLGVVMAVIKVTRAGAYNTARQRYRRARRDLERRLDRD